MSYEEALALVNGLESRPWRHGLDRMRALIEHSGLTPTLKERGYVHVAGTNGKGTTTAFVESILRHQGHRTGAFFSPYVVDYRERIQAQGQLISQEQLVRLVERLLPIANGLAGSEFGGASKFELETAMGLAYWQEQTCEWVALEVGLGGRLDATNVVTPRVCVITSIGLDHTAILGNTLEEIAAEKAGIIKPQMPVVVGRMHEDALKVIERIALDQEAPLWRMDKEVSARGTHQYFETVTPVGNFVSELPKLGGEFPPVNAPLAIAACAAAGAIQDGNRLSAGIVQASLPGRMNWRVFQGQSILLDGAHNPAAAQFMSWKLGKRPLRLVSNMLAGHEVDGFFRAFGNQVVGVEVPPIDAPRAMGVHEACDKLAEMGLGARGYASVQEALQAAVQKDDGLVVVTGSNYLVGEALRLIG